MVGLFIGFLTSGLSFVKNCWGLILWCLGGLFCFFLFGRQSGVFLNYLYFRPNDYGPFRLLAISPFLVGGFLRSELGKYC